MIICPADKYGIFRLSSKNVNRFLQAELEIKKAQSFCVFLTVNDDCAQTNTMSYFTTACKCLQKDHPRAQLPKWKTCVFFRKPKVRLKTAPNFYNKSIFHNETDWSL